MVIHDLICTACDQIQLDQTVDSSRFGSNDPYYCPCGGILEPYFGNWHKDLEPNTHPSERVILYQSDQEGGRIQYPGRGDVPVPPRLQARGYRKIELNVRDLARFEKQHHVANERRHWDRNGGGF